MRGVTAEEARTWLRRRNLLSPDGHVTYSEAAIGRRYSIPPDSGKKTALSRIVLSLFETGGECLIWITEYGIWPSCEDRGLFNGFRRALGEYREIQEAAGHVFGPRDVQQVASLLAMVLYFNWGAIVASSSGDLVVEISHDEVMNVVMGEEAGMKTFDEIERVAEVIALPWNN